MSHSEDSQTESRTLRAVHKCEALKKVNSLETNSTMCAVGAALSFNTRSSRRRFTRLRNS